MVLKILADIGNVQHYTNFTEIFIKKCIFFPRSAQEHAIYKMSDILSMPSSSNNSSATKSVILASDIGFMCQQNN